MSNLVQRGFAATPGHENWSAAEVLVHLRASFAIIAPRIWQVLLRENVSLPAFDERKLGDRLGASGLPVDTQLAAFESERRCLLALLQTLTGNEWDRAGTHEVRGEVTIRDLRSSIVDHEREHIAQLQDCVMRLSSRGS